MNDRIISNIKESLTSTPITEAPKADYDVSNARLIEKDMSADEKVSLFEERAKFSGSKVYVVDDVASLKNVFKDIIDSGSSVMSSLRDESAGKLGDLKELIAADCDYLPDTSISDDELFNTDVAITDVTLAVAETGSVVIFPDDSGPRMKSLVCTKHIALIRAGQICSDLMDVSEYLSSLGLQNLPGGFNLISGPSKTADIELQLVIGVHGPAQLYLVVIKGM